MTLDELKIGQTAVITGGFTGLGLAITRCLTAAGAKAAVISRRPPEPEILSELEGKAFFYPFDITETEHSQEIAEKIRVWEPREVAEGKDASEQAVFAACV